MPKSQSLRQVVHAILYGCSLSMTTTKLVSLGIWHPYISCKIASIDVAMKIGYVFVLFYLDWHTNGNDVYACTLHRFGWRTITVDFPHNIPNCMCTIRHKAFEVHLKDTPLEYNYVQILSKQGLGMGILRLHITICY